MIIYSVTVSLDKGIEQDWLIWMQETHIPEVMQTGFFTQNSLTKLLEPVVDDQMVTYNIQYHCESVGIFRKYEREKAMALREAHQNRYGNRFVSFRTLLQKIND